MSPSRQGLERLIEEDLDRLFAELADDWSSVELYRALAGTRWTKAGGEGYAEFTEERAHALINSLRERHGKSPLELSLSGGQGEVSDRAEDMLASVGWRPHAGSGRFVRDVGADVAA